MLHIGLKVAESCQRQHVQICKNMLHRQRLQKVFNILSLPLQGHE